MRLLVTRPEPEATELARRLAALGHVVLVAPLLRIEFAPEPSPLSRPAAIAVTSRNAVRAIAGWRAVAGWRTVPLYAVGAATAEAARQAGFTDVKTAAGDGAALAAFIRKDFDAVGGLLLYPAAPDRSLELAELLPEISVMTVEAYRAEAAPAFDPATASALREGAVDAVLLFSRRTAETFAALVRRAKAENGLRRTTLLALSLQVAEPLGALPSHTLIAQKPDEASLLALLNPTLAHLS